MNFELNKFLNQLHREAFLQASLDSIVVDSLNYKAFFHLGKKYNWSVLKNKNIDEEVLSKIGFREKIYRGKPFSAKQLRSFFNKVISSYENNGYPFASIQLDSVRIEDNKISASLNLSKNDAYRIDSVIVRGNAKIGSKYLQNYIQIKEGSSYNESSVKKIGTRIKELPFVTEREKSKVLFTDKNTKLLLHLAHKKASKFNGILGLNSDNETNGVRLTGDVQLHLINTFNKGEELNFNWRSMQKNTQVLNLLTSYPFVLNTPFGLDYKLKIYKRDTSYIDVYNKISMRYILKGNNYFRVFFHNKSSSLLSQEQLTGITALPEFADISSQQYGTGLYYSKLDYILNPKKGFHVNVNGSVGNKTIKKSPQIDPELYEGLNLSTVVYESSLQTDFFVSYRKRNVLKLSTKNALIHNENLFSNELFRIGGLKTLRGFDEESIFASLYSIGTLEYRFILEENSYFYLFFDMAYYENKSLNGNITDTPYGFGTGLSFETKAGVFSINYALGKQFDNPVLFRNAKIHFGFTNLF